MCGAKDRLGQGRVSNQNQIKRASIELRQSAKRQCIADVLSNFKNTVKLGEKKQSKHIGCTTDAGVGLTKQ